jgi:GT2 family glycosyltransferase
MPDISVAIACLNAQRFMGDTLKGLDRQSRPPLEILVVDDGSTDNSRAIAHAVPGVRVIAHPANLGIAAARNTAWRHARGDIIAYLDADAVPHRDFLRAVHQGYADPRVHGVGGRAVEIVQRSQADRWRSEVLFQHWGNQVCRKVPFLFGICASYRRSTLAACDGFDPLFRYSGEDMDLGFRLNRAGCRLIYTPHAVVGHMRRDDTRSIQKMAYRHAYGGFIAMRKNRCFRNKMTLARSLRLFLRQVGGAARTRRDRPYGVLTLRLHATFIRAWIDARRVFAGGNHLSGHNARYGWEGYASEPPQGGNGRSDRKGGP